MKLERQSQNIYSQRTGFDESDKMIATMVESSSGGNTISTLNGVAAEKVDNPTLNGKTSC